MIVLVSLIVLLGLLPAMISGIVWRRDDRNAPARASGWSLTSLICSTLLCTLAFNLTFLWQEIWLVIPKALTPGLHPILYHNNHEWTGTAPSVDLLQGTGALATALSGLMGLAALKSPIRSPSLRLFLFWLAFQGLNQALSQLAVGTLIPQNDVGRALTYFGVAGAERYAVLIGATLALAAAGHGLARAVPGLSATAAIMTGLLSILCAIPFRIPRDPIEVALVPMLSTVIGLGWLLLGMAPLRRTVAGAPSNTALMVSMIATVALLILCQAVLRPGIRF